MVINSARMELSPKQIQEITGAGMERIEKYSTRAVDLLIITAGGYSNQTIYH
jgi:hypothetical protein